MWKVHVTKIWLRKVIKINFNKNFITIEKIEDALSEIDTMSIKKIEMNVNTYEKFMKVISKNDSFSKEFKTYLGIEIWQVQNDLLPDNIAKIKYGDGNDKFIDVMQSM